MSCAPPVRPMGISPDCSGFGPNDYDHCLRELMESYRWLNTECMAAPINWQNPPPGARTYREVSSILRPAAEGVATTVVTFRVPQGYDGVLLTITAIWEDPSTGDTFVNGSGDIIWRVRVNNRYFLRNLDNVLTERGDLSSPYALEGGGYPMKENQTYSMETELGAGALARLDPNGRIICGLSGWFSPKGARQR